MNQDFQEPIRLERGYIVDQSGNISFFGDAQLRRIVACVNACAGLSTEELEKIDGRMARVLQPGPEQVSQIPNQGGLGEEARAPLTDAAAGEAPRSVLTLAHLLNAFLADIEDAVERALARHGVLSSPPLEDVPRNYGSWPEGIR